MPVKSEHPTHRQRQALATREQIGRAARTLFATQGYVATTIAAIADAADIPVQTIYSAMGSKAKILEDIAWRLASTMDIDRSHEEALDQPDRAVGLRMSAAIQCRQYEVMYDVIDVYQEAARTDPDIAQSLQLILANRERAFRRHIEAIESELSPGLSVADARNIYHALILPEIYRTLVIDRGWTPDRYELWVGSQLVRELLGR